MLDVSVSYNRFKFLGHEFLTWLWYAVENEPEKTRQAMEQDGVVRLGNRIKLENSRAGQSETITIKGDDAGLEEAMTALRKGAVVTELNLVWDMDGHVWQFTIKGESLHLVNVKTPTTGPQDGDSAMEGKILEKLYLYEKVFHLVERLYRRFLTLRLSTDWEQTVVNNITSWIHS